MARGGGSVGSGRIRRRSLGRAAAAAALVHLEAVAGLLALAYWFAPRTDELAARQAAEGERIDISTLDDATARQILAELERAEEKAEAEEQEKEREAPVAPGQVVEIPKPLEEQRPERARFAAEHDSTVARETKKLGRPDRAASPAGPAEPAPSGAARPERARAQPTPAPAPPGMLAMRDPGERRPATLPRDMAKGAPTDDDGALPPAQAPGAPESSSPDQAAPGPAESPPASTETAQPNLLPSGQQLAKAVGGGGTQDFLADVDDGDETALNAKQWKYASFFNRVKKLVVENWKPAVEYEKRDPTGRIYGAGQRVTILRIILKADGSLQNLIIEQASGLEFLDDVAMEAVKRAQPFPNPPGGLVDARTGVISFRFGFYFEVGSSPRTRVYRYSPT